MTFAHICKEQNHFARDTARPCPTSSLRPQPGRPLPRRSILLDRLARIRLPDCYPRLLSNRRDNQPNRCRLHRRHETRHRRHSWHRHRRRSNSPPRSRALLLLRAQPLVEATAQPELRDCANLNVAPVCLATHVPCPASQPGHVPVRWRGVRACAPQRL